MTTKLIMRAYGGQDDFWRIRAFLREVFLLNDRRQWSWPVTRLDYWRWHLVANVEVCGGKIDDALFLWETAEGRIGAVLGSDVGKDMNLHIHPNFRTVELEQEMLAVGEDKFAFTTPEGQRKVFADAHATDIFRQEILQRRGYTNHNWPEYQWRRCLDTLIPDAPIPEGYTVQAIGDIGGEDWPQRSWVSWRAFHPDDPDSDYEGWEWSLNWSRSPLYRRDLDIVATSPDGKVAAYCILWYDDVTRMGHFDPVAVMPEHQRRGLGRAMMTEAMRRAKDMGATLATVSGFEPGANGLYRSALSPEHDLKVPWVKILD